MDERGLCVWNGEWGPVYARRPYDGDATDAINKTRYRVLKDQLEIYKAVSLSFGFYFCTDDSFLFIFIQDRLSWSIWLYKDIGFQGMVYTNPDTPYMKLFTTFLAKKHRLAIDAWGADDTAVRPIYAPLFQHILDEVPERFRDLYPYPVLKLSDRVGRISRNILVTEFLVKEWAEHFVGKTEAELDEIAGSFRFARCVKREELNEILRENAHSRAVAK